MATLLRTPKSAHRRPKRLWGARSSRLVRGRSRARGESRRSVPVADARRRPALARDRSASGAARVLGHRGSRCRALRATASFRRGSGSRRCNRPSCRSGTQEPGTGRARAGGATRFGPRPETGPRARPARTGAWGRNQAVTSWPSRRTHSGRPCECSPRSRPRSRPVPVLPDTSGRAGRRRARRDDRRDCVCTRSHPLCEFSRGAVGDASPEWCRSRGSRAGMRAGRWGASVDCGGHSMCRPRTRSQRPVRLSMCRCRETQAVEGPSPIAPPIWYLPRGLRRRSRSRCGPLYGGWDQASTSVWT